MFLSKGTGIRNLKLSLNLNIIMKASYASDAIGEKGRDISSFLAHQLKIIKEG